MKPLLIALALTAVCGAAAAQSSPAASQKNYTSTPTGFLMVLRQGDSLLPALSALAVAEKIPSASFTGFGFVHVRFGFFDFKKKEYKPKDYRNVEMGSMQGSIAWQDGKPSIHVHGIAAGEDFRAVGGHILSAVVSTGSLEVTITVHDKKLQRVKDEELGANVLELQ